MEERPPLKPFWMVPFTLQATKGLLRDQRSRRVIMAISVGVTLLLLLCGLTVLRAWLDPHEHPWRFILYWLICGWQTLLALLLALLDILMVQAQARASRKALREDAKQKDASGE
jgi:protein-S-isoprenylcysteine O-methyltransferase Ste14